jgi:hypothetical protein
MSGAGYARMPTGEPVRYRLLESTRAYALERLAERSELPGCRQRHAKALRELFVGHDAERHDEGGQLDTDTLVARLAPELDNWRAALEFEAGPQGDAAAAVALATSGALVLRSIGLAREGLNRLLQLRDRVPGIAEPALVARYGVRLAMLGSDAQWEQRTIIDTAARAEQALRQVGSRRWTLQAMYIRGFTMNAMGEGAAAHAIVRDMAALERPDDPAWLRVLRLNLSGVIAVSERRFAEAAAMHREQKECLLRTRGETFSLGTCLSNLCVALNGQERWEEVIDIVRTAVRDGGPAGRLDIMWQHLLYAQIMLGRTDDARQTLSSALPAWRREGLLRQMGWLTSALLALRGDLSDAARVHEASAQWHGRTGRRLNPVQQLASDRVGAALEKADVPAADLERWRHEGRALGEADVSAICEAIIDRCC